MKTKNRNGSLDLLKIIAIFFIILHHYALWSGWDFESGFHLNKWVAQTLLIGGKLGVNLFVMITGFFMVKSKPKLKSLFTIWVETTVICLVVYLGIVLFHLDVQHFEWSTFIKRAFPVIFGQYWFVTSYTLLYFCIPFLNMIINRLNYREQKNTLIFFFFVLSIYPFINYSKGLTFSFLIWFFYLYFSGAFIRNNQENLKKIKTELLVLSCVFVALLSMLVNICLMIAFDNPSWKLTKALQFLNWNETVFYTRDASPLMFCSALIIFILFLRINIKGNRFLSFVSRASFGVYLLQSSPWFSTELLWPKIVNGARFSSSMMIGLWGVLATVFIYVIGLFIYLCLLPIIKLIVAAFNPVLTNIQNKFMN